ncbi:GTPase ObgE [Acetobacterium paludosum]|uniref:GTPase Obg n=1 Tax=Acetobacterium paludosum TaxID=52693 RepID=A0A923KTP3_9FIRM|nr:GTPase ObgE [Acetobacterium paludosum]MBC3889642.1 GTPase ObgE [Acetobacterium paludosum]
MFVDKAEIILVAGSGGHGGVSFRREKYVPMGGPDGGHGGHGGSIILMADNGLRTLVEFKYKRKHKAENGENGTSGQSSGKSGEDLIIKVPVGTLVKDKETGRVICDLSENGQKYQIVDGGRGGRGNMNFATATRQTPRFAQGGVRGQERTIILELKLLADVGLIGFPNVGKSTLLSVITKAKPKIANYHFTTIIPNLGVVEWRNFDPFVIADIPGLIEGAHEGTGLGDQFLRHVERTKLLIHLLDASGSEGREPLDDFKKINYELEKYNAKLAQRVQIVALNKVDLISDQSELYTLKGELETLGYEVFIISAVTGQGLNELLSRTIQLLDEIGEVEPIFDFEPEEETIYTPEFKEKQFTVKKVDNSFVVEGEFFERLINSVNFEDLDSIGFFQRVLKDKGVFEELEKMNIKDDDTVRIDEIEFEYYK